MTNTEIEPLVILLAERNARIRKRIFYSGIRLVYALNAERKGLEGAGFNCEY